MPDPEVGQDGKKTSTRGRLVFVVCLIVLTAAALTIGIVLNHTLNSDDDEGPPPATSARIDCHPEKEATKEKCDERSCLWLGGNGESATPSCVFLDDHVGYKMADDAPPLTTPEGVEVRLTYPEAPRLYDMAAFTNLTVSVEYQTNQRLRIRIYPKDANRFEIPEEAVNIASPGPAADEASRLYDVTFASDPVFGVKVTRKATNATILDTSLPGFLFYPQFLQISTRLHNSYIYGFGEHRHESFRHDMNYRTWSIFTRDVGPDNNWNLYGAHPVYMNVEDDGKANMVFLKNSNAMEVFLQPDPYPALTFRTIGGVLDFYVFLGDSPGDAVRQYTEAIGRPVLPPYWALGYQLSRWGYTNVTDMQTVINRNRAAGIPYDVQWADIDSMYKKFIFTYDREGWEGLPEVVEDLHAHHQHFVIIVDPGVGADVTLIEEVQQNSPGYNMYQDGEDAGIFVKYDNGSTLVGKVWPGITVYPDFTNSSVEDWYEKYVRFYRNNESVKVDALWIDMNEPSSFEAGSVDGCQRTTWDYPPYVPNILGADPSGRMYDKTICMSARQAWGRHYDVHSLYGHAMAMRTNSVLMKTFPGKRPWTMTRSSFAGTGHYATKWMGDNQAKWPAMHWSIIGILEFSIFGFAMNGADICGFWYETTYELCLRWHQLGAFYPFARNHNGRGDPPEIFKHQDPASFDEHFVAMVKKPLMTRYRLLPYLYTAMFKARLHGDTVMRPLMFEFPRDLTALEIDRQFLLGAALLVSPVLEAKATSVDAYFPPASLWYDYFTGQRVVMETDKKYVTLDTPLDKFNLHVRGGHVIPWQTPGLTTYESRSNAMGLMVALDEGGLAEGDLYWDDGESEVHDTSYSIVKFTMAKAGELVLRPEMTNYRVDSLAWSRIDIYGMESLPSELSVDGVLHSSNKIRLNNKIVQILDLSLKVFEPHNLTWNFY